MEEDSKVYNEKNFGSLDSLEIGSLQHENKKEHSERAGGAVA
jgi:hypothetical protein